jgi:hypothetical protein
MTGFALRIVFSRILSWNMKSKYSIRSQRKLSIRPVCLFTVQSLMTHSLVRTVIGADPPLESTLETPHDHREFIMETDNIVRMLK